MAPVYAQIDENHLPTLAFLRLIFIVVVVASDWGLTHSGRVSGAQGYVVPLSLHRENVKVIGLAGTPSTHSLLPPA
jgi:hypothetical protein